MQLAKFPGRRLILLLILACSSQAVYPQSQVGGPDFVVKEIKPGDDLKIIAYGDMRFTDPANTSDSNPRIRKWLAERVAQEKPDALFVSGDIPFKGGNKRDWDVYRRETSQWASAGLRVYPAIGNHELYPVQRFGLANYFAQFPWLGDRRWYSVQLGSIYLITLDSNSEDAGHAFDPGSIQRAWLDQQLGSIPTEINFVFVMLHMPLLNDVQSEVIVDLPDTAEIKLRRILESAAAKSPAKFVVVSGHIHNYERFEQAGITYIVSGGGGAKPYPVYVRSPQDLYRDPAFPNFNYVVLHIHGKLADAKMYRVIDPKAAALDVEVKDSFTLDAR